MVKVVEFLKDGVSNILLLIVFGALGILYVFAFIADTIGEKMRRHKMNVIYKKLSKNEFWKSLDA